MRKQHHPRQAARRRPRASHAPALNSLYRRPLRYEPLEDRRLLAAVTVNTLSDVTNLNDNLTTLREAIFATNLVAGADTIGFAPALTASGPATILLTQGELKITDALTINGPGAELLTIDASGNDPTPGIADRNGSRIIDINDGTNLIINVAISDVRMTGSDNSSFDGAIKSTEVLRLTNTAVDNNASYSSVISCSQALTITGSSITNNQIARSIRGSATITARTLLVRNSVISGNLGGGISSSGETYIADSTISNNSSTGILSRALGKITISRTAVSGNAGGGAYFFPRTNVTIQGCSFINNRSSNGGAVASAGDIEIRDCEFIGNVATNSGGAVFLNGASQRGHRVVDSLFRENVAFNNGGAIHVTGQSSSGTEMLLARNVIVANAADNFGGGIAISPWSGNVRIDAMKVERNHAAVSGGGLYIQANVGSNVRVENSTISSNSARQSGGGMAINATSAAILIQQTTISGNTAVATGGGLSLTVSGGSATVANSTFTQNGFATKSGGGMYAAGNGTLNINHTIIAGNVGNVQSSVDLTNRVTNRSVSFSLIGNSLGSRLTPAPIGSPDAKGNFFGGTTSATTINAKLAPLADNGGATRTHALLPGSPAINTGDPAAAMGGGSVPLHDQRGAPFIRVYGGRIDLGAIESQPATLLGDYNANGVVDAADYVLWRKSLGSTSPLLADGNGDGQVTDADRLVWRANFGQTASSQTVVTSSKETASAPAFVDLQSRTSPVRRSVFAAARPSDFRPSVAGHVLATVASSRTAPSQRAAFTETAMISSARDDFAPARRNLLVAVDEAFAAFKKLEVGSDFY